MAGRVSDSVTLVYPELALVQHYMSTTGAREGFRRTLDRLTAAGVLTGDGDLVAAVYRYNRNDYRTRDADGGYGIDTDAVVSPSNFFGHWHLRAGGRILARA